MKKSNSTKTNYGNRCILLAYEKLKNRLSAENICKCDTTVRPRIDTYLFDFDCVNIALIYAIINNDWINFQPKVNFYTNRLEIISYNSLIDSQNSILNKIFKDVFNIKDNKLSLSQVILRYGNESVKITDSYIKFIIPFDQEVLQTMTIQYFIEKNI